MQSTSTFDVAKFGSDDGTNIDLAHLLQYSAVEGHPTLLKYLKTLVSIGIDPPTEWNTLLTCGSTDGLNKILLILAREGDRVLVEKFTYASFLAAAAPLGVSPMAVDIDEQGMSAKNLREILDECKASGCTMPRIMYLVTVGQNPTGTVMGVERKKEIIAIANEYDLLIIEDDPYFFLQFDAERLTQTDDDSESRVDSDSDGELEDAAEMCMPFDADSSSSAVKYCQRYFDTLVPSILKFDTQGRVFRVETFSKVVAPGMRLGSITTSPVFYEPLVLLSQSSSQAPSGLSMAFAAKLMFEHGLRGWCQWTAGLRAQYQNRRDHMLVLLKDEFSGSKGRSKLATWQVPAGGMFIWFRVNLHLLPAKYMRGDESTKDIMFKLWTELALAKVLIVPGWSFAATPAIAEWKTNYFRLTYASSTMDDMDVGIKIMGKVMRKFFEAEEV